VRKIEEKKRRMRKMGEEKGGKRKGKMGERKRES
jgi:hypothetical protein